MRIAIIEDSFVQMAWLRNAIEGLGNDVVFESDSLSGFDDAITENPDAIFLDMTLADAGPPKVVKFLIDWLGSGNSEAPIIVMMTADRVTPGMFAAAEILGVLFWNKNMDSITDVIGKVSGKCRKRSPWRSSQLSEQLVQRACLS